MTIKKQIEALSHSNNPCIVELLQKGYTHTNSYQGRGRFTHLVSSTEQVTTLLDSLGILFTRGNDAPKKGKIGDFVILTSPTFLAKINADKLMIRKMKRYVPRKKKTTSE